MRIKNEKAYKCSKCGRITYPQRSVCLKCGNRTFEEMPFEKEGTLLAFTQVYQLPWGITDRLLTMGIVQFDNGMKTMGRISTPDVKTGMRLKAEYKVFREMNGEEISGWIFNP
jgi:uncharacterized protein